jgi:putative ABC transport system permease protein
MMRERLLQHPHIQKVAVASRVPSGRLLDSQGTQAEVNGEITPINVRVADIHVSHSFMETFGIHLVAGRDFDFNLASDSTEAFILNESAVRAIGWASPEEAVQKQLLYGDRRGYVIGVVKDFHFESLHQPISPMVFLIPTDRINSVAVKISAENKEETVSYLRDEWQAMRPDFPVDHYLVSDSFDQQYESEEKVAQVFGFFAGLAILISVLGLFGLSAYAAEQRTKEIGIRKVMGASVASIVTLLGVDFLKLVFFGFLIAVPIAWYGMNRWLENFAYSIQVSWIIFLLAGVSAALIAALTVSSQSIRAAMTNPVDTFKVQ